MRPIVSLPILLTVVLLAGLPALARPCSCTNLPEFDRAYQYSDAIFLGDVLAIESAEPEYYDAVWATFRVDAAWKGGPPATVRVLTATNVGACGFPFEVGKRYLVFAFAYGNGSWWGSPAPGVLWTHLCWRTHETWPEDPDLVALGPVSVATRSWGAVKVRYR